MLHDIAIAKPRPAISVWEFVVFIFTCSACSIWTLQCKIPIVVVLAFAVATVAFYRPVVGVFFLTVLMPIQSVFFLILALWSTPASFNNYLLNVVDMNHLNNFVGHFFPIKVYPFEIIAFLLIPSWLYLSLVVNKRQKNGFSTGRVSKFIHLERWLVYFIIAFEIWALFSLTWVPYVEGSFYGLVRFSCNFLIIVFLISALKSYQSLVQVFTVFFIFAVILGIIAAISTFKGFDAFLPFFGNEKVSIQLYLSVFDKAAGFDRQTLGMMTGHGLTGKHELGMYLITAIFFTPVLVRQYKSTAARALIVICSLFLLAVIFRGPMKTIILGSFLVTMTMVWFLPQIRKSFLLVMVVLIAVNIFGFVCSGAMRAQYKTKMGQTTGNIKNYNSKSRYSLGTMAFRFGAWEETFTKIVEDKALGAGAENLNRDQTFNYVHSHNLILNLTYDYGLPGFIFVALFIVNLLLFGWKMVASRARPPTDLWWAQICILGATFTCLLDYMVDCWIWDPQLYYLLGLFWAVSRITINGGEVEFATTTW